MVHQIMIVLRMILTQVLHTLHHIAHHMTPIRVHHMVVAIQALTDLLISDHTYKKVILGICSMIEKAILQRKIKHADGDFSKFMSRRTKTSDVVRVLSYAAKKANAEQQRLVGTTKHTR